MAVAGSRLALLRSARWLCTVTETANTVTSNSELRALDGSDEPKVEETLNPWVKAAYTQSIKVSEWREKSNYAMSDAECAVRIKVLAEVEGFASAEEYFNSFQGSAKTENIYRALFSCYCKEKMLENAVELFEKMKALGFASTSNTNKLMELFMLVGQPEKVPSLANEMEARKTRADLCTYRILINSYASLKAFAGIDQVLNKMDLNKVIVDWFILLTLANIYIDTGNLKNANAALRGLERMEKHHHCDRFHTLIDLYVRISDLSGVNRVWESLKSTFPKPTNTSYFKMLLALSKLGDVDTLERCFREWASNCSHYDVRVLNVLLESYLKHDMLEDANLVYINALGKGAEPNLRTLELRVIYCIRTRQIDLALSYVEMAPSLHKPENLSSFLSNETVGMFFQCLVEDYDAEKAKKFSNVMKQIGRLDSTVLAEWSRRHAPADHGNGSR